MSTFPGIPLPGGWMLQPPTTSVATGTSSAPPLPFQLPSLQTGAAPDLSGILSSLAPIIGAAVPQLAPFLPIIGVLLNILHALTMQNTAAIANGTPNQALQTIHNAAWDQVLSVFNPPKNPAIPTPPAA